MFFVLMFVFTDWSKEADVSSGLPLSSTKSSN